MGACAGLSAFVALALCLSSAATAPLAHVGRTNPVTGREFAGAVVTRMDADSGVSAARDVGPPLSDEWLDSLLAAWVYAAEEGEIPSAPIEAPDGDDRSFAVEARICPATLPSDSEGVQPSLPGTTNQAAPSSDPNSSGDPNSPILAPPPDPNSTPPAAKTATELVGFVVRGRRLVERLQINDLDSLVLPDGRRLLPLLRILRVFRVSIEEHVNALRFSPEGVGMVELDLIRKQIQVKGQTRPIEFEQAVSEITMKPDIFISPDDLGKILDMELVWNLELYEYRIQLDRKLSLWKIGTGRSLLADQAQYVEMDVPEALPTADRSPAPLQMVQFEWRPDYNWRRGVDQKSGSPSDTHSINLGGPRETIWGNASNGQYKVQVSHPNRMWSNTRGWQWAGDDPYVAQVDWFEWVRRLPSAEVTVGDSSFGLGELVYPVFKATGLRINGLVGWSPEELKADRSSLGLRRYFGQPYVFEGPAPIDATVELLLNGRLIETQNVRPDAEAPPGMGIYRFEDIELPSGILNEITIIIRETTGNEIRVERSVVGTPQLVPKGRAAYLGIAGTKRETSRTDKESFDAGDFYGYITGGRVLYGLTDRLTVGTILACERDHFHRFLDDNNSLGRRAYPESSGQAAATMSYLPLDNLILSSDLAQSGGDGEDGYSDLAARTRIEYLPTRRLSFDADLLDLESDYFDGAEPDAADRRGGETGFSWTLHKKWTLEGGVGQIRDNLDGRLAETTEVDYQSLGFQTTILPKTSFSTTLHHLDVSTENDSRILTELGLRASLSRDLSLFGQVFLGDELSVDDNDRFLSLLKLRHAPRLLRPSQYWALRKSLDPSNTLSLIYNDINTEDTLSLAYDLKADVRGRPLQLRTELIKELTNEPGSKEYGFRVRGDYLFDRVGYNSLGMTGEYRQGDYSFLLYLNIRRLYSHYDKRLIRVNESRIRTAYGAVHGKVFIDYNGNHLAEPDEPGVPDIKVCMGQNLSAVTDKHGYYILSTPARASEVRVSLDPTTVPAIYTVTHGVQTAKVFRDSLTVVNLSVTPLISVVGHVVAVEPNAPQSSNAPDPEVSATVLAVADATEAAAPAKPVVGVHITLSNIESDLLIADSYTAADGSYYLGDIKPGRYRLRVDPKTLPPDHTLVELERIITIEPTREEFIEVALPDFKATSPPRPNRSKAPAVDGQRN